ncbi:hypothetical protein K438DRAFT_1783232 [Mycena galopus ATCC 62051]|nr:hypothetical protein K438DRAFT_1783232 [Mycena galopus ATCC 62051]
MTNQRWGTTSSTSDGASKYDQIVPNTHSGVQPDAVDRRVDNKCSSRKERWSTGRYSEGGKATTSSRADQQKGTESSLVKAQGSLCKQFQRSYEVTLNKGGQYGGRHKSGGHTSQFRGKYGGNVRENRSGIVVDVQNKIVRVPGESTDVDRYTQVEKRRTSACHRVTAFSRSLEESGQVVVAACPHHTYELDGTVAGSEVSKAPPVFADQHKYRATNGSVGCHYRKNPEEDLVGQAVHYTMDGQ